MTPHIRITADFAKEPIVPAFTVYLIIPTKTLGYGHDIELGKFYKDYSDNSEYWSKIARNMEVGYISDEFLETAIEDETDAEERRLLGDSCNYPRYKGLLAYYDSPAFEAGRNTL